MQIFPSLTIRKSRFLKSRYPNAKIKYKRLGNVLINDVILVKPNLANAKNLVLKNFDNVFNLIKWTFLVSFTFYSSRYFISGKHRALNEFRGLNWSRKIGSRLGIYAPKVFEKVNNSLLIEFINGIPIDDFTKFSNKEYFNHYKKIGRLLFTVHKSNYSFGDFKAENILYNTSEEKYYFIDFEQFTQINSDDYIRRVWDITELFFYLGHIFPSSKSHFFFKKLIFTFLNSYFRGLFSSDLPNELKRKIFDELGNLRYVLIYATFMTPSTYFFVLRTIQEWKSSFRKKNL